MDIKKVLIATPIYVWLFLFLLMPCLIVVGISVSHYSMGSLPFKLFSVEHTDAGAALAYLPTLENFILLLQEPLYFKALFSSIKLALISTSLCLLIGYPIAWFISNARDDVKTLLLMLIFLPFWISLVVRVYAWKTILGDYGILNNFLLSTGLIEHPVQFLNSTAAVIVGIVYCYLPFMILPLFISLEKIDKSLIEAAINLGCTPFRAFMKIVVPLSLQGVLSGFILAFIPAIGEYVIPDLLKGQGILTVGKVIWSEFFNNIDWPMAGAITVFVTALFLLPVVALQKVLTTTRE